MYFKPLFHGSKTIAMVTDVRIHPFWATTFFQMDLRDKINNDIASKISDLNGGPNKLNVVTLEIDTEIKIE